MSGNVMGKPFREWWWDKSKLLQVLLLHGMGSDAFQLFRIEMEYSQGAI